MSLGLSLGLSLVGLVASGVAVVAFASRFATPHHQWFLGMVAIVPAWLVSLLGFLTGLAAADKSLRIFLVGGAAAAILGVIGTEYCVRRWDERAAKWHPLIYWFMGIASLVPSWLVLLRGIVVRY